MYQFGPPWLIEEMHSAFHEMRWPRTSEELTGPRVLSQAGSLLLSEDRCRPTLVPLPEGDSDA